jgi:hypothetical protein
MDSTLNRFFHHGTMINWGLVCGFQPGRLLCGRWATRWFLITLNAGGRTIYARCEEHWEETERNLMDSVIRFDSIKDAQVWEILNL